MKNVLVEEQGRWLHEDAVSAKNDRTTEILEQIAEKQIESDKEMDDVK